ncbi:MAG TPA: hypothetical protein VHM24_03890 [Gemmatimonadaceae bacterium]|nr:hypothetical protein [Gemmatimonadaceae bacterium]
MTAPTATARTIDSILADLKRFQQRATYGAVANLLGKSPRNLMEGRTREPGDCWIVSSKDGLPTGYTPEQTDPALRSRKTILRSRAELESWLENPK